MPIHLASDCFHRAGSEADGIEIRLMLVVKPRLICTILLASFGLVGCHSKAIPMTPEETDTVERVTADAIPRCLGRYMIDMPRAFSLNSEATSKVEQVAISVQPMNKSLFERRLAAREIELRSMHMDGKPNVPFLRRVENSPDIVLGKVFNRASGAGEAGIGRTLDLQAWKNGFELSLSIDATDYPGVGLHGADDPPDDTPQKLATLLSVYERVHGREESEIPSEPGMCIAHGFVRGKAIGHEGMNASYDLIGTPDVYFDFSALDSDVKGDESLLERSAKVEREMSGSDTKTIRKGKRFLASEPYEEWLMRGTTSDRVQGTMFTLQGNETAREVAKPFTRLQLLNGFRIPAPEHTAEESAQLKDLTKATLTDAEAVAIWDKVTSTLRVRPGA